SVPFLPMPDGRAVEEIVYRPGRAIVVPIVHFAVQLIFEVLPDRPHLAVLVPFGIWTLALSTIYHYFEHLLPAVVVCNLFSLQDPPFVVVLGEEWMLGDFLGLWGLVRFIWDRRFRVVDLSINNAALLLNVP